MVKNGNLHRAKREANDEFYTLLPDIENELKHYTDHFNGKVLYLNCDSEESNFYLYFKNNFNKLGIKKLLRTSLSDGVDFRSEEAVELLKECDIVVTNPPFSLFREYIDLLVQHKKKFLVVGNNNSITYKECFKLIKEGKMWLGVNSNKTMKYRLHPDYKRWDEIDEKGNKYGSVPAISWFTNLDHKKRNEEIILYKNYNKKEYPKYDNYDAINVDKVKDIPCDYDGVMGVPISFLSQFNPEQFEILDCKEPCIDLNIFKKMPGFKEYKSRQIISNGKLCQKVYHRLLIKKIK